MPGIVADVERLVTFRSLGELPVYLLIRIIVAVCFLGISLELVKSLGTLCPCGKRNQYETNNTDESFHGMMFFKVYLLQDIKPF